MDLRSLSGPLAPSRRESPRGRDGMVSNQVEKRGKSSGGGEVGGYVQEQNTSSNDFSKLGWNNAIYGISLILRRETPNSTGRL
uniref:Uncharacterized protein n=1 Tax=Vespula pensylvanica TaxID=30213 RepID=A0A834PEV9_VESPE|nr:hypothetical protein H0235_000848 [Vespula pensylvanica]